MRLIKLVVLWVLFIALFLFAISNTEQVAITFVGARIAEGPLSLVIFVSSALGMLIGGLLGLFLRSKPRKGIDDHS
ncbi:MAG: DUF1049 domain-containing protein [Myxococcales bacterium]|nr:MAG: DUF1049 domain-containing protein [Myxococcales bacterium]